MSIKVDVTIRDRRLPCLLLLDTSYSMEDGGKIDRLNEGVAALAKGLSSQDQAKAIDVAVVAFGGEVSKLQDWTSALDFLAPHLTANGGTPMAEALQTGMGMIEDVKTYYKSQGIDYARPWVFLLTDGFPTDDLTADSRVETEDDFFGPRVVAATQAAHQGVEDKKFLLWTIGIEQEVHGLLHRIAPPSHPPKLLKNISSFDEFFQWLGASMLAGAASANAEPGSSESNAQIPSADAWEAVDMSC